MDPIDDVTVSEEPVQQLEKRRGRKPGRKASTEKVDVKAKLGTTTWTGLGWLIKFLISIIY